MTALHIVNIFTVFTVLSAFILCATNLK